jgi:glycosyltransferase involved in cell wall biosynthesis
LGTRVAAQGAGSIEGIVWLLSRELTRLGHEVTVFAVAGSSVHGTLVPTLPGIYGRDGAPDNWNVCEFINLCRAVERSSEFDVIHSHAYLYGLPLERLSRAAMVHTLHMMPAAEYVHLWSLYPQACITGISETQWRDFPAQRPAAVVHHGVDDTQFTFRPQPDDYACFLGRFVPGKNPIGAIEAAKSLGIRIVLAGPSNEYYQQRIAPLVDGEQVTYAGPITGEKRNQLLGGARVLLYPNNKPEPFGLVMAEAMMCGTPVAALRCGAVAELLDEGVTGYSAASPDELPAQMLRCFALDRHAIYQRAKERFSAERMARSYVKVYQKAVAAFRPDSPGSIVTRGDGP